MSGLLTAMMSALLIVRDAELLRELWIDVGGLFSNMLDHGAARAAFEQRAETREILLRADGVDFDASVAQIANGARQMQAFGFVLSEITEADALHDSGNEIAACDLCGGHRISDCNISVSDSICKAEIACALFALIRGEQ